MGLCFSKLDRNEDAMPGGYTPERSDPSDDVTSKTTT